VISTANVCLKNDLSCSWYNKLYDEDDGGGADTVRKNFQMFSLQYIYIDDLLNDGGVENVKIHNERPHYTVVCMDTVYTDWSYAGVPWSHES